MSEDYAIGVDEEEPMHEETAERIKYDTGTETIEEPEEDQVVYSDGIITITSSQQDEALKKDLDTCVQLLREETGRLRDTYAEQMLELRETFGAECRGAVAAFLQRQATRLLSTGEEE
jgi:hypothetical protein